MSSMTFKVNIALQRISIADVTDMIVEKDTAEDIYLVEKLVCPIREITKTYFRSLFKFNLYFDQAYDDIRQLTRTNNAQLFTTFLILPIILAITVGS